MIEVIKFYVPNCGPCKVLQITFDRLMEAFREKPVTFTYVDASEDTRAQDMGVTKAPTAVILKDGIEMHRFVGALYKYATYFEAITALLEG